MHVRSKAHDLAVRMRVAAGQPNRLRELRQWLASGDIERLEEVGLIPVVGEIAVSAKGVDFRKKAGVEDQPTTKPGD